MKNRILAFFVVVCLFFGEAFAQKAEVFPDTNALLIGDQIKLSLSFSIAENADVRWPLFKDTLSKSIEIINTSSVDTLLEDGIKTFYQSLTITSFDSGFHVVRPFVFEYVFVGDTVVHSTETEAFLLEVNTVAFDTSVDIKDIKDIFKAYITFRELLPYLLGIIALAALVYLVWYYIKKRKDKQPFSFIKKHVIPPHIEALEAFEVLRKKKLWQNNFVKEYYSELTDILRIYIERTSDINAMEQTTDEIIFAMMNKSTTDKKLIDDLKEVLSLSDLVKFAKFIPFASEHDLCYEKCVNYVKKTTPQKEEMAEEKKDNINDINSKE